MDRHGIPQETSRDGHLRHRLLEEALGEHGAAGGEGVRRLRGIQGGSSDFAPTRRDGRWAAGPG